MKIIYSIFAACLIAATGCQSNSLPNPDETEFTPLFDGKSFLGWSQPENNQYKITDGAIHLPAGGKGNLLTEKQYSDFVLRFEFKLSPGANNGLAIRAPLQSGSLAYEGMELQILDNPGAREKYENKLRPNQYHGAIYNIAAPNKIDDLLNPPGEWNTQEVIALGRRIVVRVNGRKIVDYDLNSITDPKILRKHPGILRASGHIGFLGHNDEVFFRNLRIKELPVVDRENRPPPGFTSLFDGQSLAGWNGLLLPPNDNPIKRAALTPEARIAAQAVADENMLAHWSVEEGTIHYDGKGKSLSTARHDYANYELHCDWKITANGDSGIYLRGVPQVQIWDARAEGGRKQKGSGGLFNNEKGGGDPAKKADHAAGTWNRFRILIIGDRVHVFLNNQLVLKDVPLENYWDRKSPLPPSGPIELQAHGNPLWFKNIYIREIK